MRRAAARATSRPSGGGRRGGGRRAAGASGAVNGGVDRDALLQVIFPGGIPAREEIIRRARAWLDEAEQLAASK